jgi:anti-sigma B factor antagonist
MEEGFRVVPTGPRGYRLVGELDISTERHAEELLLRAVEDPGDLDLDLSELRFMDSTGIRLLLRLTEQARGSVRIHAPSAVVERILEVAGLERIPNLVVAEAPEGRSEKS